MFNVKNQRDPYIKQSPYKKELKGNFPLKTKIVFNVKDIFHATKSRFQNVCAIPFISTYFSLNGQFCSVP